MTPSLHPAPPSSSPSAPCPLLSSTQIPSCIFMVELRVDPPSPLSARLQLPEWRSQGPTGSELCLPALLTRGLGSFLTGRFLPGAGRHQLDPSFDTFNTGSCLDSTTPQSKGPLGDIPTILEFQSTCSQGFCLAHLQGCKQELPFSGSALPTSLTPEPHEEKMQVLIYLLEGL